MTVSAPQIAPNQPFLSVVSACRKRLGLEQVALRSLRSLAVGFGIVAAIYCASWIASWRLGIEIALGLLAVLLTSTILGGLAQWPSAHRAVRDADHRLALEERLTTAYDSISRHRESAVSQLQMLQAAQVGREKLVLWRPNTRAFRREAIWVALLGTIAIAMILLSTMADRLGIPHPTLPTPLETQAPEVPPDIAPPTPAPTQDQSSAGALGPVLRSLDDMRKQRGAGGGGSQEDQERRLNGAESELQRQAGISQSTRQDLDRLSQALNQTSAGRGAAESIDRGDFQKASEQLSQLGAEADQLSQEAKQQLSQELRDAAAQTGQNRILADREKKASDALAGHDYSLQQRTLRDLGNEVARAGGSAAQQQDLANAMSQIQNARQELGQNPADQSQNEPRQALSTSGQSTGQAGSDRSTNQSAPNASSQQSQPGTSSPAQGAGNGSNPDGNGSAAGGDQPGKESNTGAAPRLEAAGRHVEVPVKVGRGPTTQRPGEDDPVSTEDQSATITSVGLNENSEPSQISSERNLVPNERRQAVRDYFQGETRR